MLPSQHELTVDAFVKFPGQFSASCYMQQAWSEPHRHYHTLDHLNDLLTKIKENHTGQDREILTLVAYFHDVIYEPLRNDNEERCADLVRKFCTHSEKERIANIVLDTKQHLADLKNDDPLSVAFCKYDSSILTSSNFQDLLNYEDKILKEFQVVDYQLYKEKRVEFLTKASEIFNNKRLLSLADYVQSRKLKVGLYCGSFNPFHLGHYSILFKAEQIFDKVIICSGINPEKIDVRNTSAEQVEKILNDRLTSIKKILPYHQIHVFSYSIPRLLENFAQYQLSIVKGIRGSKDLEEENLQRAYIEDVVENYSIIYIPADRRVEHISSSGLRFLENEGKRDEKSEKWANMYKCDVFKSHPIQKLI